MKNMKTKYTLIILLAIITSTTIYAEKDKNNCDFSKKFVTHNKLDDSNILSQTWVNATDPDSDEYISTQHLIYKNGDIAVVEHKFCSMYNFELTYFVAKNNIKATPVNIGNLVEKYIQQSSAVKPRFKSSLAKATQTKLEKLQFSSDKNISTGITLPDTSNKNVEQTINYVNLENNSSVYSSMIGYYLGIGGN